MSPFRPMTQFDPSRPALVHDRLTFALVDQASTASDNGAGSRTAVNTDPPAIAGRPTFLL